MSARQTVRAVSAHADCRIRVALDASHLFMFRSLMRPPPRLRDYPFVTVRFACRDCPRIGRYRLAVLAERFGADAPVQSVLETISTACPRTYTLVADAGRICRTCHVTRITRQDW